VSKTLGAVLGTLYGPVSGYAINGGKGFLQGLGNATAAISGPVAFGAYVAGAALGGIARSRRAEQTETAIKSPVPVKMSGYGTNRINIEVERYL
jgi:hypothetical protein